MHSEKKKSKFLIRFGTVAKTVQLVPKITKIGVECVPLGIDEIFLQIPDAIGMGKMSQFIAKMCTDSKLKGYKAWKCDKNAIFHIFMLLKPSSSKSVHILANPP